MNNYNNENWLNSRKREQIEYDIGNSPSQAKFNYSVVSSKKTTSTVNTNNYINNQRIMELQNEINKIKGEYMILENEKGKLIEQIELLKNQINILNEENKNLKENYGINENNNEVHKIIIQEIEKLSKEISTLKNENYNEYKKWKDDELAYYKSQNEELLRRINQLQNENNKMKLYIQKNYKDSGFKIIAKGEIIQNKSELEFLIRKICKNHRKTTLNLLYKATVDSDKAKAFHSKCDEAKSSLVLIKSGNGKRFGGFTTKDWKGKSEDKKDDNAFVFSLDKMKIYDIIPGEDAIGCYPKYGPIFLGCQIRIFDDDFTQGGTTYEANLNYKTEENFELTGGQKHFDVKEIEVYEVKLE